MKPEKQTEWILSEVFDRFAPVEIVGYEVDEAGSLLALDNG